MALGSLKPRHSSVCAWLPQAYVSTLGVAFGSLKPGRVVGSLKPRSDVCLLGLIHVNVRREVTAGSLDPMHQ